MSTTTRIVVGVDGSTESRSALRWARQLAPTFGASIEAVSAWHLPVSYGASVSIPDWDPARDAEQCLTETVDAVFGAHRPAGLELVVAQGGAAAVLLDRCQGATLLVVGSRGHGGFAGLLLGSVSTNVAEHAPCPVLVVHGDAPAPELATVTSSVSLASAPSAAASSPVPA